jgi:uncharacterized membrane protein
MEQRQASRDQKRKPSAAATGLPDWPVVALSVAGLIVAGYLTWLKWAGGEAAFCAAGSGCDMVQASHYAVLLGVPTALWGACLYAVIAVLAGMGLTAQRWLAAFLLAAAGVGFSVYLTALSAFVVRAACVYCLASSAIAVVLLGTLLWRRQRIPVRRPLGPARLIAYGMSAAAAAIVFGAFWFAAPSSAPAGYQLALARHLRATGAIMYGAYW